MNHIKNTLYRTAAALAVISLCICGAGAENCNSQYNWYCMHTKGETVPDLDPSFSFIKDHNCIYIDKDPDAGEKTVYLTFDAGYENGNVATVLDVLKDKDVQGAFFILENIAEREPELIRRMADEGHLVCNHTAKHLDMTKVGSKEDFASELKRLEDKVFEATGVSVAKFYRPPEGCFNEDNLRWADELGYRTVFWSFAYADWDNEHQMPQNDAFRKIVDGAHPGEIMLLHPTSSTNAAILGKVIDRFKEMGYTFRRIDRIA